MKKSNTYNVTAYLNYNYNEEENNPKLPLFGQAEERVNFKEAVIL
jgi:hypothetical protein